MEQEAWRILIVGDDRRLAELTREYLEGNGLKVDIEANGALAAARILAERPDLVVLDLMLPGEDGLSICRQVRPQFDGPILMLTARTDDMDGCSAWRWAPTTTCASRCARVCCWRASVPCCGAARRRKRAPRRRTANAWRSVAW